MASIGAYTVTQFRITMPRPHRPIARQPAFPGVNNYILLRGAPRVEMATGWTAVDLSSRAATQSLLSAYLATIGTVVTVVDQFGVSFQQCTILNVFPQPSDKLLGGRLEAYWSIDVPYL
jgi:hypothetical protein